jgi:hypothetical protein
MSTRQTLRDYLGSIGSTATGISLPVDPGSDGVISETDDFGIEPNTGIPLIDFTAGRSFLGDYTSFITKNNSYPIAPGVHEAASSDRGSALPRAETEGAMDVFADSSVGQNALALDRSNSAQFDASGYPLNTIIDKTGAAEILNGNVLLSNIVAATANSDIAPEQTRVVEASFAALRKYNNFSPTDDRSSFSNDNSGFPLTTEQYNAERPTRVQVGEGKYEPDVFEISAEISQETLTNIARSMILRSAGWDTSLLPADSMDPNSAFDNVDSGNLGLFPSVLRNGQENGVDAFRSQDSYGMPQKADGSSILSDRGNAVQKSTDEARYTKTRGSTYTADTPFGEDPTLPASERIQSLQAGIAMVGLAALIDKKIIDVDGYVKELTISDDKVLRGPYYMGTSLKSDVGAKTRALVRTFMFQTGIYSYSSCIAEGLYACMGFESLSTTTSPFIYDTPDLVSRYASQIKDIAKDEDVSSASARYRIYSSPGVDRGFWRSVSESAIRTISNIQNSTINGSDYAACLLGMKDVLVVKIMNVFASIGYQRLIIQGFKSSDIAAGNDQIKNPYAMDDYPSAPGTRQMKSRDGSLLSNASLAWRNSSLPSAFILPVEAMAATLDLDYMFDAEKGANPIKGMLGSTLYDKTYVKASRNDGTIPSIVSKLIEDRLGSEYVPFYFKDLRTNEVIAFHAFLETLTDGFTAAFAESKGFGRADPVQNYTSTSRSIGLTFWIVATSKEDFDEMWFKINKLTTLLYPQYTRGRPVTAADNSLSLGGLVGSQINFEQPFSQLAGGTPVVRLRVGDVIKSNYSRSNFAKLFGVGNDTFSSTATNLKIIPGIVSAFNSLRTGAGVDLLKNFDIRLTPFLLYAASPMEITRFASMLSGAPGQGIAQAGADLAAEFGAYFLKNGFVNPLIDFDRKRFLKNNKELFRKTEEANSTLEDIGLKSRVLLKARATPYTAKTSNSTLQLRLRRPVFAKITSVTAERTGTVYTVALDDSTVGLEFDKSVVTVSAADLYVDAGQIVDIIGMPGILLALGAITGITGVAAAAASAAISTGLSSALDAPVDVPLADFFGSIGRTFTSPYNNPITRAFEDRMGEGLAGVVKSMSFAWMESPWEIDWNSRAPTACKVTISFAPIHDISPGLDSNGFNRAPIYNVGQIMHDGFGSSRADGGVASRHFYRRGGATAENAKDPEVI